MNKTEEEKRRLFGAARSLTSVHRANFKQRREEIEHKRLQLQLERERNRQRKHAKQVKEKEDLTKRLAPLGLWTKATEVECGLQTLKSKKEKQEALKIQIDFRRKVLCQSYPDKTIFYFTHLRKALTECQLKSNLFKLLPPTQELISADADPELLIYRRIRHKFECDGSFKWYDGTVLSYNADTKEYRVQYDNEDEAYSFPLTSSPKTYKFLPD